MSARYSKDNVNEAMSMPALFVLTALMSVSLLQNTSYTLLPSVQGVFVYKWYSFFIGCAACWTMLKIVPSGFFWINLSLIGVYAVAVSSGAYATCLVALVIFGVAMKDKMHNFLTSFAFQYLGRISYSLYLLHWAVGLKIIDNGLRISGIFENNLAALLVLLVIALGASVLAADVFYRFIEMPSLSLSRHFKRRSHLMAHADRSQGECT